MTRKPTVATTTPAAAPSPMSQGQRAYEERRAAEAGMSLDAWLAKKTRDAARAASAEAKAAPKPAKKPGLLTRLLDRAHKPLG